MENQIRSRDGTRAIVRALQGQGTSCADISRELGVSRQHISQVLKGRSISARVWKAIIAKLGWDPRLDEDAA